MPWQAKPWSWIFAEAIKIYDFDYTSMQNRRFENSPEQAKSLIVLAPACKTMDFGARRNKHNNDLNCPGKQNQRFGSSPGQAKSMIVLPHGKQNHGFGSSPRTYNAIVVAARHRQLVFIFFGKTRKQPQHPDRNGQVGRLANINLVPTLCRTLCQPWRLLSEICFWIKTWGCLCEYRLSEMKGLVVFWAHSATDRHAATEPSLLAASWAQGRSGFRMATM